MLDSLLFNGLRQRLVGMISARSVKGMHAIDLAVVTVLVKPAPAVQ